MTVSTTYGNVSEWVGGFRLVKGEVQILENNDAADSSNSQSATSAQWKAIDGTTGELIDPDGNGTTENSIKLDMVSSKWQYVTGAISNQVDDYRSATFASMTCADTVCAEAKEILIALAMLPDDSAFDYQGDYFYANNGAAERTPFRGGIWSYGSYAGVFCTILNIARSNTHTTFGFRSAYYKRKTDN